MADFETIKDLLAIGADDAPAIGAPERDAMDYAGLRGLADKTVTRLNELGVGRNDRVAIVLPNSSEMAAAFVAIGCGATTAPLNPAYRQEEFDFYLDDLDAKALVVEEGSDSPALAAAAERDHAWGRHQTIEAAHQARIDHVLEVRDRYYDFLDR